jgi:hypothetical protein
MYQQVWGYKVEDKLYLGVREQKRLNTTALEDSELHTRRRENLKSQIHYIYHLAFIENNDSPCSFKCAEQEIPHARLSGPLSFRNTSIKLKKENNCPSLRADSCVSCKLATNVKKQKDGFFTLFTPHYIYLLKIFQDTAKNISEYLTSSKFHLHSLNCEWLVALLVRLSYSVSRQQFII